MKIAIAEDSALLREGLVELLSGRGHQVLAAAGNAEDLFAALETVEPDVVILDNRMPPTHTSEGIRAALLLRQTRPEIGVLLLSQYVETRYATQLFAGQPSGTGYLLKDRVADVGAFLQALERIRAGETVLDPEVVRALMGAGKPAGLASLTPREQEVLELMAQGRTNAGICAELFLSAGAVEKHITSIFGKLDLLPAAADHRRVLAVLHYLEAAPPGVA
ncbi:response regulator transcription factor [Arthrobacter caoxuetaonis]|uniref:Response regulator transcription factor n=1 Tax=Arthrobacter caoxuetaonis TaxID=2886935 RepID=A0A9X1MCY1_9MICC|nr:response regulator transcription factor [Arthrobacter caoxuetaonis]MCC3297456.1 response regulator transcription factor [Arthrobacter caoxuetaonis]USQ58012.1 response regulator transcription factor [Arthrobacter caoxuetaonis]